MKTIEVYKGFNIFEAEGDFAVAGFKYQIDITPIHLGNHKFFGCRNIEHAKKEIDWISMEASKSQGVVLE